MMFFKVITLITICAADPQLLLSELLSEQEVAPHPLPFDEHIMFPVIKYDKVDEHSTLRSKPRSIRSALQNTMFRKLQYAPLREGMRDYPYPTPTHSIPVEPTEMYQSKKSRQYGKSHLEPRTEATDKKCYAQGSKKKAKSSANRSPGHNAVYRIISEPKIKEKQVTDYNKPIGINLDLKSMTSTTDIPLIDISSDNKHLPLTVTQEHLIVNPNSVETNLPMQDKSKRYSSHPKYHRLHLNIARVYSPGQVPPKPPAYARAYPEHFGRPPKTKVYRPESFQDQSKNTMLFPVKHHKKGFSNTEPKNGKKE